MKMYEYEHSNIYIPDFSAYILRFKNDAWYINLLILTQAIISVMNKYAPPVWLICYSILVKWRLDLTKETENNIAGQVNNGRSIG